MCWSVCQAETVGSTVAFPAGSKITIGVLRKSRAEAVSGLVYLLIEK